MNYADALTATIGGGEDIIACTTATTSTIDSAGRVGYASSIAIGSDGPGLIGYHDYDGTNGYLRVAHRDDAACSTAITATLDSEVFLGGYASIAIGADGLRLISYLVDDNAALRVAHCEKVACSIATTTALDSTDEVGLALRSRSVPERSA